MFIIINTVMAVVTIGILLLLIYNVIKYQANMAALEKKYKQEIADADKKELKKRKEILAREKKANEQKKELREGTDTDNFNSSLDIMHKYANRNH